MSSPEKRRRTLKISILGTRGIPAGYGGFETFAEELSTRLAERGHLVTVYGRRRFVDPALSSYRGVRIRVLPCLRHKYLETVSHTFLSALAALRGDCDVVLVCNAANAIFCWIPGLRDIPVVLNVDGIERLRKKWNLLGRWVYRMSEFLATQIPDVAVSDARAIQSYYLEEYGAETRFIAYGAPVGKVASHAMLDRLGLRPGRYLLYVSRLEPENNAHLVMEAYLRSSARFPLAVVGDAPYSGRYIEKLKGMARRGDILLPGAIYGLGYRELLSHCLCFIQATEVGGTHPALIEALGAGCLVLVNDTPENREVAEGAALLYAFNDVESLRQLIDRVSLQPGDGGPLREAAERRVRERYDWTAVVNQYEALFYELIDRQKA